MKKKSRVTREPYPHVSLSFFMDDPKPTVAADGPSVGRICNFVARSVDQRTLEMSERMVGTVAGINRDRGFFFICGDGRDYFALARDLPNHRSLNTLVTSVTRIEFTPVERGKGPAAENLVVVEDEPTVKGPIIDTTARRLGVDKRRRR